MLDLQAESIPSDSASRRQQTWKAWKFSGLLNSIPTNEAEMDALQANFETEKDILQANFKRLIADRTQVSKAPNITFMIVVRGRNSAKQAVVNGYIEAQHVSEARWLKWLPMFEWIPIEGGLHCNEDFQALMADANTAFRLRATLHQQGQLSAPPKRVRIVMLLHACIPGYLPMIRALYRLPVWNAF